MKDIDISRLGPAAQRQILRKLQAQQPAQKQKKYGNQRTEISGIRFDSKKEARRFQELYTMYQSGEISGLRMQEEFTLQEAYTELSGERVRAIRYRSDFTYYDKSGHFVVEDVKSEATRKDKVYRMKRKMMADRFGIAIQEI